MSSGATAGAAFDDELGMEAGVGAAFDDELAGFGGALKGTFGAALGPGTFLGAAVCVGAQRTLNPQS